MTNINWNGDAESAPFKSRFDDASENLILAETDTGTALFEWDGSAWQFRGPVEMNGEDVSGIGSLTATSGNFDSVNTDVLETDGPEGWGEPVVEFDDDPDAEDITVSLDSQTEEGDEVLIDLVRFEPASSGELRLTVDTGGDGDYSYQMSNATSPSQNANFVQLVDMSDSFAGVSGRIILREVSFGVAVIQKLAGGRADRINAIVSFGSVDATGVGDITFSLHDVGDREFREMTFDVYQRSRFDL